MPRKLPKLRKGPSGGSQEPGPQEVDSEPQESGDPEDEGEAPKGNVSDQLKAAMAIDGAIGVALVDSNSGMTLGTDGGGIDLEVAAAANSEVVRAEVKTVGRLGLSEKVEDILITLGSQFHLIRLSGGDAGEGLFFYLALDKQRANLAMARRELQNIERALVL